MIRVGPYIKPGKTTKDSFLEKIDSSGDCWLWIGSKNRGGYGQMGKDGKTESAHRISWKMFRGRIPVGMMVCHKCDVPACVNPAHLFLGTAKDNMRDMHAKGRANLRRGQDSNLANLCEWQVKDIRRFYAEGASAETLAQLNGVSADAIRKVIKGASWAHVPGARPLPRKLAVKQEG